MGKSEEISKDVGTELLFENDRVKVWSMALEPGETSPYHQHDNDYVFVYTRRAGSAATGRGRKSR